MQTPNVLRGALPYSTDLAHQFRPSMVFQEYKALAKMRAMGHGTVPRTLMGYRGRYGAAVVCSQLPSKPQTCGAFSGLV
jgi:hypothetical protein